MNLRQSRRFAAVAALEHRMLGVAFLALLASGAWLTYAAFDKSFVDYDEVTLHASKLGLQLPEGADVKVRGVQVGEVVGTELTADGVDLTLGIYPSKRTQVPADVTARLTPKTLFGEKFVALVPQGPGDLPIEPGARIEQAKPSLEVERALRDVYPLLRTVRPAEVNHTLTALATALEGRGEGVGENLATLQDYLSRTNRQLPALVEDLRMLGEVSDTYRAVMPEIARLLRNSVTTGDTVLHKEQKIQSLFTDVSSFSSTSRDFLEANGDGLTRLGELDARQLRLLERYSPQYPCLLDSIVKLAPRQAETFRGYTLHINLELLPAQPRGFGVQDDPLYGDRRGPHREDLCRRAMDDEWGQDNLPPDPLVPDIVDGVEEPTGKRRRAPALAPSEAVVHGGAEARRTAAVTAPLTGVPALRPSDMAALLLGPLLLGMGVGL